MIRSATGGVRRSLGGSTDALSDPADPEIAETVDAVLVWVVGGNLVSTALTRVTPRATSRA